MRTVLRRWLGWLLAAGLAFWVGHHVCHRTIDFIVYYQGARSLLAGRMDLYSNSFAWGPPLIYVYPPLFLLCVFPIGWLSFASAFGVWFAAMIITTALVIRRAYRQWRPPHPGRYAWLMLTLPGPFVVDVLRYGNVHLFIVLLLTFAVLEWSSGKVWTTSFAVALGGAIKIFPLFLLPIFAIRREWGLVARVTALTCVLWLLPAIYFGPQRTVSLYRTWSGLVVFHLPRFESQRPLDESLGGAIKRWFTHVEYSTRRDRNYPEPDFANLSRRALKTWTYGVEGFVFVVSMWVCFLLRPARAGRLSERDRQLSAASAGVIFVAAQLVLGPYTTMLYFSGWLLVALVIPAVAGAQKKLYGLWLLAGTTNVLFFLVPGAAAQRALQAYGAFTVLALLVWTLSIRSGWILARTVG